MTTNAPLSASDPIFRPLPSAGSTFSTSSKSATLGLLSQAFPGPEAAQQVYSQKLEHRPLSIIPADTPDARELRRTKTTVEVEAQAQTKAFISQREEGVTDI